MNGPRRAISGPNLKPSSLQVQGTWQQSRQGGPGGRSDISLLPSPLPSLHIPNQAWGPVEPLGALTGLAQSCPMPCHPPSGQKAVHPSSTWRSEGTSLLMTQQGTVYPICLRSLREDQNLSGGPASTSKASWLRHVHSLPPLPGLLSQGNMGHFSSVAESSKQSQGPRVRDPAKQTPNRTVNNS